MTAKEVYERCKRELDPAREYRCDEIAPLFGLRPDAISTACYLGRCACVKRRVRGREVAHVTGAAAIEYARERMAFNGHRTKRSRPPRTAHQQEQAPC